MNRRHRPRGREVMSVNKVILLGRLGKDPELRYTNNQMAVCSFSLATSERRKDQGGNWVEQTEWHNIKTFGKTAENVNNYLKKGRECFIEGRIQTRKWQDKEGRDRYTTEILADNVKFVGGRGEGGGRGATPADEAPPAMPSSLQSADSIASADEAAFDDDDIPF